jgi:hypothetical protein
MMTCYAARSCGAAVAALLAVQAWAALPIELEVAAEGDAPFGAMQEWNKVLAEMDLARVRLRGASRGDQPALTVSGDGAARRFRLVGLLNRRDELVLPGGKFAQGDRARLKQFFEELPRRVDEEHNPRGRFGLTREDFALAFADLSGTVTESTLDGAPHELVATLTRDFAMPVSGEPAIKAALRDAPPFKAQMKGLTSGTVLAAVLRAADLQFVPERIGNDPLTLRVTRLDVAREHWPVGWKPLATLRQTAPAMYRITNIEIENYTLARALEALGPHMATPLVIDQRVLALRKIEPAKVQVRFPRSKTYVRRAVDSILSQGRLAGELRVDEAGQPFYWITQFDKDSPRALEIERARTEK